MHLKNGTYEQIVSHLEKKLELKDLEALFELQINTVTQQATQQNQKNPYQLATTAKSQVTIEFSAINSTEEKTKPKITRKVMTITTTIIIVVKQTVTPTINLQTKPTQTIQIIKMTEDPDLSTHPVTPVVKLTIPHRKVTLEQTQRTDRFPETYNRKDRIKSNKEMPKATQMGLFKLQP